MTPASRSSGEIAAATAARRLAGPSNSGSRGVRIAPVTTTGFGERSTRSQAKLVSSIVSVPWTTTTPSTEGSSSASWTMPPISRTSPNVKWLAGVRPRSIRTISAMVSSPGVRARIAAPSSAGMLPPAAGSNPMLIVPPVNTIATRAMAGSASGAVGRVSRVRRVPRVRRISGATGIGRIRRIRRVELHLDRVVLRPGRIGLLDDSRGRDRFDRRWEPALRGIGILAPGRAVGAKGGRKGILEVRVGARAGDSQVRIAQEHARDARHQHADADHEHDRGGPDQVGDGTDDDD